MRPAAVGPCMKANPATQKASEEVQKSTRFLIATLMLFLARTRPVSRQVNPPCMSMTRAAQINSHKTSMFEAWSGIRLANPSWEQSGGAGEKRCAGEAVWLHIRSAGYPLRLLCGGMRICEIFHFKDASRLAGGVLLKKACLCVAKDCLSFFRHIIG